MTPVFITARLDFTRLPRKHLLPLGPMSVIEHVVRRCQHFGFAPTVCVPESDQEFEKFVPKGVPVFGGDIDVAKRLIACSEQNNIERFHHLDGDDPFFDDESVRASMYQAMKYNVVKPSHYSATGAALCGTSYNRKATGGVEGLQHGSDQPWPVRLTLDYPEDYHLILAVNRMVGGHMAPRWAVNKLFKDNPDLYRINWFRNEEWKKRQDNERE